MHEAESEDAKGKLSYDKHALLLSFFSVETPKVQTSLLNLCKNISIFYKENCLALGNANST